MPYASTFHEVFSIYTALYVHSSGDYISMVPNFRGVFTTCFGRVLLYVNYCSTHRDNNLPFLYLLRYACLGERPGESQRI